MGDFSYQHGIDESRTGPIARQLPICGTFKKKRYDVAKQLDNDIYDYRPFFTWYVTTVQIALCLYYLAIYGIGTNFDLRSPFVIERSGEVLATSLSTVHIVTWQQNNIWIGPNFADLVHMGAKYSPCMRRDKQIYERIFEERRQESETGCCVGIDGCYQTSECPKQFASFMRYANATNRSVRAVCGQDPRYCNKPRSIAPYEWSGNISNWPICEERSPFVPSKETHMQCEVVGRPCCIQMQGQCRITTKEYCDFVQGYYHENATLCSQIDCLNDICGMTQFRKKNHPDQFYRFFLSLFIHAGLIRLLITCAIQFTVMRRFEILIGWRRVAMIYLFSGIGGYIASATFQPYMPETGPAGSQGGILGGLIVVVLYNWKYIKDPGSVLLIHVAITLFLLFTGFLPFIDNWGQIFGLIFGGLWAAVLIPYLGQNRTRRYIIIGTCGLLLVLLYAALLTMFIGGFDISPNLAFLNCPFPGKICDHQGSQLKSWLPI